MVFFFKSVGEKMGMGKRSSKEVTQTSLDSLFGQVMHL